LRVSFNLSERVALDLGFRIWKHGERDYGLIAARADTNASFRIGMRFYWGGR
jgi:opacity protein-like surface antigen